MTFFPAMRLPADDRKLPRPALTLVVDTPAKTDPNVDAASQVPVPPESYRGLHLVSTGSVPTVPGTKALSQPTRSIVALRDRVAALAAALLLLLAAT